LRATTLWRGPGAESGWAPSRRAWCLCWLGDGICRRQGSSRLGNGLSDSAGTVGNCQRRRLRDCVGLGALGDRGRVGAVRCQYRDDFRGIGDSGGWLDDSAGTISDCDCSGLGDSICLAIVYESRGLGTVSSQLGDHFCDISVMAWLWAKSGRLGPSSGTIDDGDSVFLCHSVCNIFGDRFRGLRRRWSNNWFGHSAGTVCDRQSCGLRDCICLVVLNNCGRRWTVRDDLSYNLRCVGYSVAGRGSIGVTRMS